MRSIGDSSASDPPREKDTRLLDAANAAFDDSDLPQVRHIELDVDLDMFSAEPTRSRSDGAGSDARANLKVVPQIATGEAVTDEPDADPVTAMPAPQGFAMFTMSHVREVTTPGSVPQRIALGVLATVAVTGALWWAGTVTGPSDLQPVRSIDTPAAASSAQPDATVLAVAGTPGLPAGQPPAVAATSALGTPAIPLVPAAATPVQPVAPVATPVPAAPVLRAPAPTPELGVVAAGWLRVDAPIALEIANGGNVIGTSRADRTMLPAGDYDLIFSNDAIGYREGRRVSIAAGRVRQVDIRIPDGAVSVNARPWANVTIDGRPIGETPLGNITIQPGVHQVVFTHPQLGERRMEAVVRAGQHVRLNVDLTGNQE